MPCSPARLAANISNARKSTGPRTLEGKEQSRANALKHGFCSEVVRAPEDQETIKDRARLYYRTLKPQNDFHSWVVEEIAVITLRIDRLERIERRERDRVALRAEHSWDDDRRSEAEELGSGLAADPARVRDRLAKTLHGCEWLIGRWALLAREAEQGGGWGVPQVAMAYDLLGTPAGLRGGKLGELVDLDGRVDEGAPGPSALAGREIAALRARMGELAGADELDRAMAMADMTLDRGPELRRLRRYESSLHRRLRWCLDQLQKESKYFAPHPSLRPHFEPEPESESAGPGRPEPEATAGPSASRDPGESVTVASDANPPDVVPDPDPDRVVPQSRRTRPDPAWLKAEARLIARRAREGRRLLA